MSLAFSAGGIRIANLLLSSMATLGMTASFFVRFHSIHEKDGIFKSRPLMAYRMNFADASCAVASNIEGSRRICAERRKGPFSLRFEAACARG
jgi:hypothetical protein